MTKIEACLVVLALVGLTFLAPACDLQCGLRNLVESASHTPDAPCHPGGQHSKVPAHDNHAWAVAKAVFTLHLLIGPICVRDTTLNLQETWSPLTSVPSADSRGFAVLRI